MKVRKRRQDMVYYRSPEVGIGWFTLALINAGLAQSKGRSGLLWWLVSLLLGPIATFLIVILERVPPARW
jgi:type IV secretory pathway VirB2 component (pilin)